MINETLVDFGVENDFENRKFSDFTRISHGFHPFHGFKFCPKIASDLGFCGENKKWYKLW